MSNPKDTPISRREALTRVGGVTAAAVVAAACEPTAAPEVSRGGAEPISVPEAPKTAATDVVLETLPLGFPWTTTDPFLFCVHHLDHYPAGNEGMGIDSGSLGGRRLGSDFSGREGWSMYHGNPIPGFPSHPHRGFETITLARQGFIDHSDSLGATARFGHGDVQWMTAGHGIVHAEMFPLIHTDKPNPTELFQIWLNLPRDSKMVEPHFTMMWDQTIPKRTFTDDAGRETRVTVIAGSLDDAQGPTPPPASWASRPEAHVAIFNVKLSPGARWTLPAAASPDAVRTLYFFLGDKVQIGTQTFSEHTGVRVDPTSDVALVGGSEPVEIVMLQGKPISEPVAKRGPFVMNTSAEIAQAYEDYRKTGFGGWPWPQGAPVHPRDEGRFAIHADGRKETAEG